jgi:hypothetical protein
MANQKFLRLFSMRTNLPQNPPPCPGHLASFARFARKTRQNTKNPLPNHEHHHPASTARSLRPGPSAFAFYAILALKQSLSPSINSQPFVRPFRRAFFNVRPFLFLPPGDLSLIAFWQGKPLVFVDFPTLFASSKNFLQKTLRS